MTKLNQFFRDAGAAISRSPEVRQAVGQAVKQVELKIAARVGTRFADGFEAPRAKPAAAASTGSNVAADGDFVKGLYRELLGREPDIDGFNAHMAGLARGASRDDIRNVFLGSSEFAEKQAAAAAGPTAPTEPKAPVAPANNFGDPKNLGPVPLEGFDSGKLANADHKSVKYLFGRVATHFPLSSVKSHADADALLNKMVPDLRAAGLDIVGVKGDKLLMKTPLGLEAIDVVRGAGGGNPGWWWGADGTVATPAVIASFPPLAAPTSPTRPVEPTPTQPTGALVEPGAPLRTVPLLPEFLNANIDKSSPDAAALSAARWAKATYPELFTRATDRNVCAEIMGKVIGALRVAGYDATRVVNHSSLPDGARWGSDAVVINGNVFDVYRAMGEASEPVAQNQGPYEAGRLRE